MYPFGHQLFAWADTRHCHKLHNASYDACPSLLCRLFWWLENLLWYGGEAGR